MIYYFDLAGVAVFAISGALVAGYKRMDLFGVLVLALVTAVGGGTLRDLLLGARVFWVADPTYVIVAGTAALLTAALGIRVVARKRLLLFADAAGLALFTVLGAHKATVAGTAPSIAIVMGVMTGVVGGAVRDLLAQEIPLVLRREIYATAAFVGACVFVLLLEAGLAMRPAAWTGLLATLGLRVAAIHWKLSLPVFSLGSDSPP